METDERAPGGLDVEGGPCHRHCDHSHPEVWPLSGRCRGQADLGSDCGLWGPPAVETGGTTEVTPAETAALGLMLLKMIPGPAEDLLTTRLWPNKLVFWMQKLVSDL